MADPTAGTAAGIYVILGMHKSGTTLVARLLANCGIDMGEFDPDRDYDDGGHFERADFQTINKALLGCGDRPSVLVRTPLGKSNAPHQHRQEARNLVASLQAEGGAWGFKDPRSVLTYRNFWRELLPPHQLIAVFRSPEQVTRHYGRIHGRLGLFKAVLRSLAGLTAWCAYNAELLEIIREHPQASVFEYDKLIGDQQEYARFCRLLPRHGEDARAPGKPQRNEIPAIVRSLLWGYVKLFRGHDPQQIYAELQAARQASSASPSPQRSTRS